MKRRGPKPDRELLLARAVIAVDALPKESRPTRKEIADIYGVSVRQLHLAYAKHKDRVSRERDVKWTAELMNRLATRDARNPSERAAYDQTLKARIEYEKGLALMREALKKKRSRK